MTVKVEREVVMVRKVSISVGNDNDTPKTEAEAVAFLQIWIDTYKEPRR